ASGEIEERPPVAKRGRAGGLKGGCQATNSCGSSSPDSAGWRSWQMSAIPPPCWTCEVQAAARILSLEVATFEPGSCRPPAVGCARGNRLYGPVGGLIAPGAYMKRHELSRCSAVPPTMCHLR